MDRCYSPLLVSLESLHYSDRPIGWRGLKPTSSEYCNIRYAKKYTLTAGKIWPSNYEEPITEVNNSYTKTFIPELKELFAVPFIVLVL